MRLTHPATWSRPASGPPARSGGQGRPGRRGAHRRARGRRPGVRRRVSACPTAGTWPCTTWAVARSTPRCCGPRAARSRWSAARPVTPTSAASCSTRCWPTWWASASSPDVWDELQVVRRPGVAPRRQRAAQRGAAGQGGAHDRARTPSCCCPCPAAWSRSGITRDDLETLVRPVHRRVGAPARAVRARRGRRTVDAGRRVPGRRRQPHAAHRAAPRRGHARRAREPPRRPEDGGGARRHPGRAVGIGARPAGRPAGAPRSSRTPGPWRRRRWPPPAAGFCRRRLRRRRRRPPRRSPPPWPNRRRTSRRTVVGGGSTAGTVVDSGTVVDRGTVVEPVGANAFAGAPAFRRPPRRCRRRPRPRPSGPRAASSPRPSPPVCWSSAASGSR